MAAPGNPSLPHPRLPARLQPGRRSALLLALALLGATILAGCLAPDNVQSTGDCPPTIELPATLPEPETRTSPTGHLEIRDATGTWTEIDNHTRIVATSHDLVELLFLLDHGERLVAVPNWIDHPPGEHPQGIDGLERLGIPHVITAEEMRAQDPTLVLDKPHPLQPNPLAESMRNAGVDVIVFDNQETLTSLAKTYALLGALLEPVDPEAPAKADGLWSQFVTEINDIQESLRTHIAETDAPCYKAVYQFPSNLLGAQHTASGLLLELAGARNMAAEAGLEGYNRMSSETLMAAQPERVLVTWTAGAAPASLLNAPRWQGSPAAEIGVDAVLVVDPATTGLTGPRYTEGLRLVAQWLHPAAFGLIEPDVVVTVTQEQTGTPTVSIDASGSQATNGTLEFRFLPGDGEPLQSDLHGTFTHTYGSNQETTARLLIIDEAGRIHEERIRIGVDQ